MLFFKGFSPNSQDNVKSISIEPAFAILKQKKTKKNKKKFGGATFNMFENSQK